MFPSLFLPLRGFNTHLVQSEEGGGDRRLTPYALPWLQLPCSLPNLFSTVSASSAGPVLSRPTASLGQLFTSRFTFLLILFSPSRAELPFCLPFGYKMGLLWDLTVLGSAETCGGSSTASAPITYSISNPLNQYISRASRDTDTCPT